MYEECVLSGRVELRGLSVRELEKLPKMRGRELGLQASECCICLESVEPEDPVRLLPGWNHGFHSACIDAWLSRQTLCPLCRSDVRLEPPDQCTRGDSGSMFLSFGSTEPSAGTKFVLVNHRRIRMAEGAAAPNLT
uniref:RING-type domain-containing protein n=1 Tax=Kalanchoe fedtschenkoi TaxID=63787 RepID=A0A7N0ULK1_KALFE